MPVPLQFDLHQNQLVRNSEEFQRLQARLQALSAMTADAPLEVWKNGDSIHIAYNKLPDRWFRITGKASAGSASGMGSGQSGYNQWPTNYYTAEEIIYPIGDEECRAVKTRVDPSNAYPLIEINGNGDVENGSLVFARAGFGGTHYEFLAPGASGVSSDVKLCRVAFDAVSSGGIRYYPCTFNELDVPNDIWLEGPLVEDVYDCFLVQRLDYDLTVTSSYGPGIYTGLLQVGTKTLTVDGDSYTLPVYATTDAPFLGPDCDIRN